MQTVFKTQASLKHCLHSNPFTPLHKGTFMKRVPRKRTSDEHGHTAWYSLSITDINNPGWNLEPLWKPLWKPLWEEPLWERPFVEPLWGPESDKMFFHQKIGKQTSLFQKIWAIFTGEDPVKS